MLAGTFSSASATSDVRGVLRVSISRAGGCESSSLPPKPADADPGEHDDIGKARQQRKRVTAVPGIEVEHSREERNHHPDWAPACNRAPKCAERSALAENPEQDQDGEEHARGGLDAIG